MYHRHSFQLPTSALSTAPVGTGCAVSGRGAPMCAPGRLHSVHHKIPANSYRLAGSHQRPPCQRGLARRYAETGGFSVCTEKQQDLGTASGIPPSKSSILPPPFNKGGSGGTARKRCNHNISSVKHSLCHRAHTQVRPYISSSKAVL